MTIIMQPFAVFLWLLLWSTPTPMPDQPFGALEWVNSESLVQGWAIDPAQPDEPVQIAYYIDDALVETRETRLLRSKLNAEHDVTGRHGFLWLIPDIFLDGAPHTLAVYALDEAGTRYQVAESPWLFATDGYARISAPFGPSEIVIRTTPRVAGAIDSVTWNGQEFINSADHGRQMQSAANFDTPGHGFGPECFNPTEAGSRSDGAGSGTTSQLLFIEADGPVLRTETRMAFWLRPHESARPHCPQAQNEMAVSEHILKKTVTIGFADIPNVIAYRAEFIVPEGEVHTYNQFEALTGYMPTAFSTFWTYDPRMHTLSPLSAGPGEQALPVILATPDEQYAMGVYAPYLPQPDWPGAGFGRFRFPDVVKWNCVFRFQSTEPLPTGSYDFRCYVALGTLQDVTTAMDRLHAFFNG